MRNATKQTILKLLARSANGQTTLQIAHDLNLSRSATSLYLNQLAQQNLVLKQDTYPIIWQINGVKQSILTDAFQKFIGVQGSCHKMIKQCKAAISYPPTGLPILIHGNSGVGKTFLAHLTFEYLHQQHANCAAKLVVFNCADYANNPELLSSALFGYRKGAFTGATQNKTGLLTQANGGMLFLDEVHRLSFANQEKLFRFMDTGEFQVVGASDQVTTAQVRLIFATTEDPSKVLLPTFLRRIVTILELTDYHQRPLAEREALLRELIRKEGARLHKNIQVDEAVFHQLLHQQLAGNIGELKNQVQILCAQALQSQQFQSQLIIGDPQHRGINITPQQVSQPPSGFNQALQQKLQQQLQQVTAVKKLQDLLWHFAESHFTALTLDRTYTWRNLQQIITDNTQKIMGDAQLVQPFLQTLMVYVMDFSNCFSKKLMQRFRWQIQLNTPRLVLFTQKITIQIPKEYQKLMRFLLQIFLQGQIVEDLPYQALLVAHGNSTASSIQAVANQLCHAYLFDAIDMPINSDLQEVILKVKNWLAERDTAKGVIMLVDMGSLTQLYKSLKPEIQGELLVINNLTTSFALEIGQHLLNHHRFIDITENAKRLFQTKIQYFEGFSDKQNIIIASILGFDIAQKLQQILQPLIYPDLKIIVMNFKDLTELLQHARQEPDYLKNTKLILTTSYLEKKTTVPTFNLLDITDEEGDLTALNYKLQQIINPKNLPEFINRCISFFSKKGLSEKLNFLNPEIIIKQVESIIEKCERRFSINLNNKTKFNLMIHLALMVERTILDSPAYPVPVALEQLQVNGLNFYTNVKDILHFIENFYHITISDWELYILYEIIIG